MEDKKHISSEEINGLVQHEAGNEEYIQLNEERINEIQDHLFHCEDCNRMYALSKKAYVEIASDFEKKETKKPWYWVAAAAVLILSFFWLKPPPSRQEEKQQVMVSVDKDNTSQTSQASKPIELPEDKLIIAETIQPNYQLLAINFETNPELEELVSNSLRSRNLKIITPVDGQKLNDDIRFEWTGLEEVLLTLKIMDNTENVIHEAKVKDGMYDLKRPFLPGRYYWSLETDAEVLFYGTFFNRYEK